MPGLFINAVITNAVITAGGPIAGEFARMAGTDRKALAVVRGRTMLARAIDALRENGIERIAVVGNADVAASCDDAIRILADTNSGTGNVLAALDAWPADEAMLFLTCDMPYLDAAALRWVLAAADPCELAMPLTEHARYLERFAGAPEAGITLAGERVVNGGVFHLPAGSAPRVRTLATSLFQARKAPWKMARIAGLPMLLRFALGRAGVGQLEARAEQLLALPVRALRGAPPELAFDADTADDYRYAQQHD